MASATFGVFFGLKVLDFDRFLRFVFLCLGLHVVFHLFVVVCVVSAVPNS